MCEQKLSVFSADYWRAARRELNNPRVLAFSGLVCAMAIVTGRSAGIASPIFAVACVVAIITMHDAMGVRHETGEQAKVLNQMIEQWIDISEKNAPFLQNMHLKEMVGHTPLQVLAGVLVGVVVGCVYPMSGV